MLLEGRKAVPNDQTICWTLQQSTIELVKAEAKRHQELFLLPWLPGFGEPESLPLEPSVNAQERGLYRLESPLTCNTSAKIWPANTPGVLPCHLASALTSSIVDCCKVHQIV